MPVTVVLAYLYKRIIYLIKIQPYAKGYRNT